MSPSATVDITFSDDGAVDIGRPKPCPFKHAEDAERPPKVFLGEWGDYHVHCDHWLCEATGPKAQTEAMAIRAWNERSTE